MGNKINLGRVAPVFKGDWMWDVEYDVMDIVRHDEKSWVALENVENIEPGTNDEYWALVAEANISEEALALIKDIARAQFNEQTYFVTDDDYHHTDYNFNDRYKDKMDRMMPSSLI
jgi:hypothetical protein